MSIENFGELIAGRGHEAKALGESMFTQAETFGELRTMVQDTVRFQGEITSKSEDVGRKLLECQVKGINQRGELVSLSDASLAMGK